jgi:hypothetical protein
VGLNVAVSILGFSVTAYLAFKLRNSDTDSEGWYKVGCFFTLIIVIWDLYLLFTIRGELTSVDATGLLGQLHASECFSSEGNNKIFKFKEAVGEYVGKTSIAQAFFGVVSAAYKAISPVYSKDGKANACFSLMADLFELISSIAGFSELSFACAGYATATFSMDITHELYSSESICVASCCLAGPGTTSINAASNITTLSSAAPTVAPSITLLVVAVAVSLCQ